MKVAFVYDDDADAEYPTLTAMAYTEGNPTIVGELWVSPEGEVDHVQMEPGFEFVEEGLRDLVNWRWDKENAHERPQ